MNKVIVITGGSEGLGKAMAKQLSKDSKVIILALREDILIQTAKELNCQYYVCDVVDFKQCKSTIEDIISKNERIDVLINNAGLYVVGELDECSEEQISNVVDVNVKGAMNMSKCVIPFMKKQKTGDIINIVSQAGFYPRAERSIYNASKFALTGFTKCLQIELAKFGIKVTGVYPGKLNTDLLAKARSEYDYSDALDTSEVAKAVEFIVSLPQSTFIPEIGIKNILN